MWGRNRIPNGGQKKSTQFEPILGRRPIPISTTSTFIPCRVTTSPANVPPEQSQRSKFYLQSGPSGRQEFLGEDSASFEVHTPVRHIF